MSDKLMAELKGLVRDAMSDQVVAVSPKASAAEAAELLSENGVRHAIIVDSNRHVIGLVSQRDVLKHFIQSMTDQEPSDAEAQERAPWELGSLIQREPVTVLADVSLASAGTVLTNSKIGCLPVADDSKRLVGSLSIVDILRHIAGKRGPQLEEEFKLFKPTAETKPQIPAFFRRSNGALVMPLSCLDDASSLPGFAMLGYDGQSGRILVKLTSEKEEGARKVVRDNDLFVIPASDFVACFDIKFHGSAFEITRHARTGCFILSPKQNAPRQSAAPAVAIKK